MFKKILLATTPSDESRGAADLAFAMARPSSSKLYIFHAYGLPDQGWGNMRYLLPSGKVAEAEKELEAHFKPDLETVENYEVKVVPGVPEFEILRYARKNNVDVIVMGPHQVEKNQPRIWGMTGSTIQKVSLKARCPVMIVPPDMPKIFHPEEVRLSKEDRINYNILVVDDELSMRDSLREWLTEEGFTADMADSGEQALEMLSKKTYQLMLTDIKMPGIDGVTLLEKAAQYYPRLSVVMMTAYATIDTALRATKKGALDYLVKPFDPEQLLPKLRQFHQNFELTRGRFKLAFSNIVLATDFSEPALCAFNFALDIAQVYDATLHIFHVLPDTDHEKLLSQAEVERNIQEALSKMEKRYGSELSEVVDYSMDSWEGVPHAEILKFARWKYADLIIMAHHSRERDPESAVLGSTVIKVASSARCPVLSINKDFIPRCCA